MKKLVIREIYTAIHYKSYLNETIIQSTRYRNGKLSREKAIKELADVDYLTKSLEVEVIKEVMKIPYDVMEALILASTYMGFHAEKNTVLKLNNPIYCIKTITEFKTLKIKIVELPVDDELKDQVFEISSIPIPKEVLEYIKSEYSI